MARYLSRFCTNSRLLSFMSLARVLPQFSSKFEADVIDDFTSQLMQRKIGKWELKKRKNEALLENCHKTEEPQSEVRSVDKLGTNQLSLEFQDLIENGDSKPVISLIKQCVDLKKLPPVTILLNILSICAQSGDKELITQIQELCKEEQSELLQTNSNFCHFMAEATWVRGDVVKALEMFEETYRENAYLRRRIRLILKYLITDLVANGSEAALGNMIGFSERIVRDFHDFFPLCCVWQACFLSEWFTDQCVALELLEKHSGLLKYVINRISYVVFVSLKCHRTEVVYRLLEILLKYRMKQQYSSVLASLLDYHFQCGDLVQCSEIIRWAIDNNVALPKKQHIKLINLLLNQKMKTPLALLESKSDEKPTDFKF